MTATNVDPTNDRFTFKNADIHINGTPLIGKYVTNILSYSPELL
jgi:hypothetical protein